MEDKKELTPAEVDAKLTELESKLTKLQQEKDQAIKERDDLQRKVNGLRIDGMDLGHQYITHGDLNSLYKHYKLDANSIASYVQEVSKS